MSVVWPYIDVSAVVSSDGVNLMQIQSGGIVCLSSRDLLRPFQAVIFYFSHEKNMTEW